MTREEEIRERADNYDRAYLMTGGQKSPWQVEDLRYLLGRVAELEASVVEWEASAELGCENPPPGCDCPGCSLARERAGRDA